MRKSSIVLLGLILLMISSTAPTYASNVKSKTDASKAVVALQRLVSLNKQSIVLLGQKFQQDSTGLQTSTKLNLDAIKAKFDRDSAANDLKISSSFNTVNTLSKFKVLVNNLSRCNGTCASGTILDLPFDIKDESAQRSIDQNVAGGAMAPLDKPAYDLARKEYLLALDQKLMTQSKYQQDVVDSNSKLSSDLRSLNYSYTLEKEKFDEILKISISAQKAAKRSFLSGSNYETNFKVALAFEYNLQMIQIVASSPFSTITSVLSARAVLSAADDYERGSQIDSRYSNSKAIAFNKMYGNTFTSDQEFIAKQNLAIKMYRTGKN